MTIERQIAFWVAALAVLIAALWLLSPVMLPFVAGIALAAVLVLGYRIWPGIMLGAFLANITSNEPVITALSIAMGNTLEALIGAWLLNRYMGGAPYLERMKGVFDILEMAKKGISDATTFSRRLGCQ